MMIDANDSHIDGHKSRRICRAFRTLRGTHSSRLGSPSSLETRPWPVGTSFFSEFITSLLPDRLKPYRHDQGNHPDSASKILRHSHANREQCWRLATGVFCLRLSTAES